MIVLGIETSCDDTSVALLKGTPTSKVELLAMTSFSQEEILGKWGGVVPEIASRNHVQKLPLLIESCFQQAKISLKDCDQIAVTASPGLLGPLLTGINAAKTLSLLESLPISPVNHLHAHLLAINLDHKLTFPFLGLLVSGGHTALYFVSSPQQFTLMGTTLDDAAGEAFDKGGKLLGLSYPAGKEIDQLAKQYTESEYIDFPIGLKNSKDFNFSFSGVKTSLKYYIEQYSPIQANRLPQICYNYQNAIVEALNLKTLKAIKALINDQEKFPLIVGGGVACNSALRKKFQQLPIECHFVPPRFCTDNAAMVANYALLMPENAQPFPQCLDIDAKSKIIDKKQLWDKRS